VLGGLPQHEEIFWVDMQWLEQAQIQADPITLPPQETIDVVQKYCKQLGLKLTVSE
jgi:transcription initiation factor TFIIIB Brf1 subunit/transcription initiation factor TFIIB